MRTGLRTSRPAAALLLSGPRGLRRDLVDVLRALLPDPQLYGRFGQCQLELLDLGALPPLDQAAAAAGLARPAIFHRRFASVDEPRSEEHTSELQSRFDLVCRL